MVYFTSKLDGFSSASIVDLLCSQFNFDIFTDAYGINHSADDLEPLLHFRPRCGSQNHNRQFATRQVLIGCDKRIVTGSFGSLEQIPILQCGPSEFSGSFNNVIDQVTTQQVWNTLIKNQVHATDSSSARASKSKTASICSRVTLGNHSITSSMLAPSRRFSNKARMGTRVPRNTHAPLTTLG